MDESPHTSSSSESDSEHIALSHHFLVMLVKEVVLENVEGV